MLVGGTRASAEWNTVYHMNQRYVSLSQIPQYYREYAFTRSQPTGNVIRFTSNMSHGKTIMDFQLGSPNVYMNGVKFNFSFPIVYKDGRYLVSQIDLVKLINPILRPSYIDQSARVRTVVLDPGHGGRDPGTVNNYGYEKDFALKLAQKVRAKLEQVGFHVVMTRYGDQSLELEDRVRIANRTQDAIFVSLHFNSVSGGGAEGIETFTLSPPGSATFGRALRTSDLTVRAGNAKDTSNIALATAIHGRVISRLGAKDRGIKRHSELYVLRGIKHPTILFEGGFMSHPGEALKIKSDTYLDQMAHAIYEGIVVYKTATERR